MNAPFALVVFMLALILLLTCQMGRKTLVHIFVMNTYLLKNFVKLTTKAGGFKKEPLAATKKQLRTSKENNCAKSKKQPLKKPSSTSKTQPRAQAKPQEKRAT